MIPIVRHPLVGLVRSWLRRSRPWPGAPRRSRPTLECLEGRVVPSTMSASNLPVQQAASPAIVARATDVPQQVDFPDVFTISSVNVPQSATIASVKVQLDITYPLDNDLTIDLIAPDGTDVSLSSFEGTGANFQNTI